MSDVITTTATIDDLIARFAQDEPFVEPFHDDWVDFIASAYTLPLFRQACVLGPEFFKFNEFGQIPSNDTCLPLLKVRAL